MKISISLRTGPGVAMALGTLLLASALAAGCRQAAGGEIEFGDVERQTAEFMRYEREITLTPEQNRVMQEALDALPAPCCSDRTATTCCCPCNMAKSWWGLSKHLIADLGYDAERVRETVSEWIEFIHPQGYAGDACYRGRCGRPFKHDGCGGMSASDVRF